jgi:mono/diheme cytochrome c family protein
MSTRFRAAFVLGAAALLAEPALAQLVDRTTAPNTAGEGIQKSFTDEVGAGRGDVVTPDSSAFIIARDPFRAIRRGRQLFQRKFTRALGHGPAVGDGAGDIDHILAIGAGLSDSCAGCHGRPRGSAGFGGDVVTRPDSRDAQHLFGLGLKEMLGDEITADLRAIRADAIAQAQSSGHPVTLPLTSKGIHYGRIRGLPDGSADASLVKGVNGDLRVRPLFFHGGTISIREFVVGALQAEMGLQAVDPDLDAAAHQHATITTPAGMVLNGALDQIEPPPTADPNADPDADGVANEVPTSLVDFWEFYLLNYFKPATYVQDAATAHGADVLRQAHCTTCHIPDLTVDHDRRVADVETVYDPVKGIFNRLYASAVGLFDVIDDGTGFPPLKVPKGGRFLVRNIYTDLKRHDVGPAFYERNYDGTLQREFMTTALWGVGSTAPYGHDGRSLNLSEVILRHGGEATAARDAFAALSEADQSAALAFLNSLILFPPDDTASNLDPGDPGAENFPQFGHGSVKLTVLFNDPSDKE